MKSYGILVGFQHTPNSDPNPELESIIYSCNLSIIGRIGVFILLESCQFGEYTGKVHSNVDFLFFKVLNDFPNKNVNKNNNEHNKKHNEF